MKLCIASIVLLTIPFGGNANPPEYSIPQESAENGIAYSAVVNDSIYCRVEIFRHEKLYAMEVIQTSCELCLVCTLSYGKVQIKGKEVHFHDTAADIVLQAQLSDEKRTLRFTEAFPFMKDIDFLIDEDEKEDTFPVNILHDEHYAANRRKELLRQGNHKKVIHGKYSVGDFESVTLNSDYTYSYCKVGYPVSTGTWLQIHNMIIFTDDTTQWRFYMISEPPNLRSMLLPGDEDDKKMKYVLSDNDIKITGKTR